MRDATNRSTVMNGNPVCPRCGGTTYDLERKRVEADGVTKKSTVYWCNNSECDVDPEKGTWNGGHFWTLDDIERINAETSP